MKPQDFPASRYSFSRYNSKHRMLTYWYQINEVLSYEPSSVLEIGVGSGLVASYLSRLGIEVTTVDVNPELQPDHVGSVTELVTMFAPDAFDVVVCARVLHHLPFELFERSLEQLATVAKHGVVLTLPQEDFRLYLMFRYTSSGVSTISLPLPLFLKRALLRQRTKGIAPSETSLWKIGDGDRRQSLGRIRATVASRATIVRDYPMAEDRAHYLFSLRPRDTPAVP